jgi:hypothetical protein
MNIKINNKIIFNEISGKYTKSQKFYNIKQLKFESNDHKEIQLIELAFPLENSSLEYHIHQKDGPCEVRTIERHTEDQSEKIFIQIEKDKEYFIKLTYDSKNTIYTFINFDNESESKSGSESGSESESESESWTDNESDSEELKSLEEKISKL